MANNSQNFLKKLQEIRQKSGVALTTGLDDREIEAFLARDPQLALAIDVAHGRFKDLAEENPDLLRSSEESLLELVQQGFLSFYANEARSPYLPLAAKGPWIVTVFGAVIYDTGGYGMLGLGHSPDVIDQILGQSFVMANIMTPNLEQLRFTELLREKIGFAHNSSNPPYQKFACMNSGSEANSVAARIIGLHAKRMSDPGAPHAGKATILIGLKGGFHGRTLGPALASDSSYQYYQNVAFFRDQRFLFTCKPNDCEDLISVFDRAKRENLFVKAMFMEPVMGEGNPGLAITPEFYNLARKLTQENNALLVVDSVQAGFRAHGCLSILDYPGFANVEVPDIETFSKALNAGQVPFSLLAMRQETAELYIDGVYGNTMTANPRALSVACAVLEAIGPDIGKNVVERGKEFLDKLRSLEKRLADKIHSVQGTGLLLAAELDSKIKVVGPGGVEEFMRLKGVNVIHGGQNAIRYTPSFKITTEEIDLIIKVTEEAIRSCS